MLKKLFNKKMKLLKNQQGLTLIELLVVIVILGIIAAVAIPMVMGQQNNASKNTNAQNLSILQDAVNRYYTMNSVYPATLETLKAAETSTANKGGPFIEEIPKIAVFKDCSIPASGTTNGWTYSNTGDNAGKVIPPTGCTP